MLQKFAIHELCARISFDQEDCFYYVIVGEEAKSWCFLLDVPNHHALIIRATDECLPILGHGQASHPAFVACESPFTVACGDFPEPDRFVSGCGQDQVTLGIEADVGDVVVVSVEGLEAEVVVVDVPEFDGEIG